MCGEAVRIEALMTWFRHAGFAISKMCNQARNGMSPDIWMSLRSRSIERERALSSSDGQDVMAAVGLFLRMVDVEWKKEEDRKTQDELREADVNILLY